MIALRISPHFLGAILPCSVLDVASKHIVGLLLRCTFAEPAERNDARPAERNDARHFIVHRRMILFSTLWLKTTKSGAKDN
jgi:hypothetical protein